MTKITKGTDNGSERLSSCIPCIVKCKMTKT